MTPLQSLSDRLAAATCGSRELDLLMESLVKEPKNWSSEDIQYAIIDVDRTVNCAHYTTSLGAILALCVEKLDEKEALDLLGTAALFDVETIKELPLALCLALIAAWMMESEG